MDEIEQALATAGAPYGMSADQMIAHIVLGNVPHPDAEADECGASDPRDSTRWCALAKEHPGENHCNYAPDDGCRTWTEHGGHRP